MKSFNRKDVFTLATAEEAKAYIGKQGYFGDSFGELEDDIKKGCSGKLVNVYPDRYTNIVFRPYASDTSYGLFLPVDKVIKVEETKKYRPFKSIDEFADTLGLYPVLGNEVIYHRKNNPFGIARAAITRTYVDSKLNLIRVTFGDECIGFDFLFEYFEWKDENGHWKPFGVLENELGNS